MSSEGAFERAGEGFGGGESDESGVLDALSGGPGERGFGDFDDVIVSDG